MRDNTLSKVPFPSSLYEIIEWLDSIVWTGMGGEAGHTQLMDR